MIERANCHMLHHRETDPPGSDFRKHRYAEEREVIIRSPSNMNRVLGILAMVILPVMMTMIGFLVVRDRQAVDSDIATLQNITTAHALQLQAIQVRQDRMMLDLQEINRKLDEVLARTKRIQ